MFRFWQKRHVPIGAVVALHLGLSLAFNLTIPIFESPDESNHFLFVRYVQAYRALPIQDTNQDGARAHHPPLYYLLGALISGWVPIEGDPQIVAARLNPHFNFRYDDPSSENKAQWIHSSEDERWPFRGMALAVHLVRLVSALFSALSVGLTYATARHLWPSGRALPLLAACLIAFNPQIVFLSSVVNNDTAGLASAAAIVWALSAFSRRGWTIWRWAIVGLLLALGLLLKTSGFALLAPIAWVLLSDGWKRREPGRVVFGGLALMLPVMVLVGWWFWRNQILYGDWTGNAAIQALWGPLDSTGQFNFHLFWTGLIGRFGLHGIISYPLGVYQVVVGAAVLGLAGWVRPGLVWLQSRKELATRALKRSADADVARHLWGVHGLVIIATAAAMTYYAVTIAWSSRYALGLYPSVAMLWVGGINAWIGPHRRYWVVPGLGLCIMVLPIWGYTMLVLPTYALPVTASEAELRLAHPVDAVIDGVARIHGYTAPSGALTPGQELLVTVYWEPLARTAVPYTVFVHLVRDDVGSVSQQDLFPGRGNYATTDWDIGRVFVDSYRLRVPVESPAGAQYRIVIGLYDSQTMLRLPVTGADAGRPEESWVMLDIPAADGRSSPPIASGLGSHPKRWD